MPVHSEAVYELKARADNGEDLWFAASLLFDHSGERPIQVQGWRMGTKAEIDRAGGWPDPEQLDEAFYALLLDWYNGQYPNDRWYFWADQPGAPREGDLRMGPIHYEGGMRLNETIGEVYTVEMARYENGQFWALPAPNTLVLSRSGQDLSLIHISRLIAACHVLLRLLMPRHSPCALISLTNRKQSFSLVLVVNYAGNSIHIQFRLRKMVFNQANYIRQEFLVLRFRLDRKSVV